MWCLSFLPSPQNHGQNWTTWWFKLENKERLMCGACEVDQVAGIVVWSRELKLNWELQGAVTKSLSILSRLLTIKWHYHRIKPLT